MPLAETRWIVDLNRVNKVSRPGRSPGQLDTQESLAEPEAELAEVGYK
jgi:hypothetical protein